MSRDILYFVVMLIDRACLAVSLLAIIVSGVNPYSVVFWLGCMFFGFSAAFSVFPLLDSKSYLFSRPPVEGEASPPV